MKRGTATVSPAELGLGDPARTRHADAGGVDRRARAPARGRSRGRPDASRLPTACSTSCTSATSATSQGAAREADRLVVAVNADASVRAPQGAVAADPRRARRAPSSSPRCAASTTSSMFAEPTVGAAARAAASRTCTARAPTTPSTPCPNARSCGRTAAAPRSAAIRRTIRPATSSTRILG